jgi:hypothetical protein
MINAHALTCKQRMSRSCSSKKPFHDPYFSWAFETVGGRELIFQQSKRIIMITPLLFDQEIQGMITTWVLLCWIREAFIYYYIDSNVREDRGFWPVCQFNSKLGLSFFNSDLCYLLTCCEAAIFFILYLLWNSYSFNHSPSTLVFYHRLCILLI